MNTRISKYFFLAVIMISAGFYSLNLDAQCVVGRSAENQGSTYNSVSVAPQWDTEHYNNITAGDCVEYNVLA
nr:hypothetical protein [bacterium]